MNDTEDLKKSALALAQISEKALAEVERLRRQRLVLANYLVTHRRNSQMDLRELHTFAKEIHHLHDEIKTHQTALLAVAAERDTARKELAAERRNATELVATLQTDLDDARSAACELEAKWRIAVEAEHFALQQITKAPEVPKAPWRTRVSQCLDRLAARILLGKDASRSLEALDG